MAVPSASMDPRSTPAAPIMAKERLYRIVEDGMCVGCGLCESIAGRDVVEMRTSQLGYQRPHAIGEVTQECVDQIYDVCPGLRQDSLPDHLREPDTRLDPTWGPYRYFASAHAADDAVRIPAATGGVLTALAQFLVDSSRVSFVLHARPSTERVTDGVPHVSVTAADVSAGSGSIYGPVPILRDVRALLDRGEPFAVVAKPCDLSALRRFATYDARVTDLVRYWLAPTCGGSAPGSPHPRSRATGR